MTADSSTGHPPLFQRLRESRGIPGWIDLQVNGHAGVSFTSPDLTVDQVREATRDLVTQGTRQFLPTVITTAPETLEHSLNVLGEACEDPELEKNLLGIHLEGPFLSPEPGARGAHPSEHMENPTLERFQEFQEIARGHIRLLTLAPECHGALELIGAVSDRVVCSAGHSMADYQELRSAVEAGLKLWTHLGNGLPVGIHRHDNPVVHVLAVPQVIPSLIADGYHIPESFIRAVLQAKGTDRCFVVSDQSPFTGMPPGEYVFGDTPVVLEPDGFLRMRDEPYLAGSSRNMNQCMEYLESLGFLDQDDLVRLGYETPRQILGLDDNPSTDA